MKRTNGERAPDLSDHLRDSLKKLWRRYRKRLKRCRKEFSEEAVHQLRIETRRLLAKLDLLAALLPRARVNKARRLLKERLDAFDPLRDTQVKLLATEKLLKRFPEARPFRETLQRRERRLARDVSRRLRRCGTRKIAKAVTRMDKQIRRVLNGSAATRQEIVATVNAAFGQVVARKQAIDGADTTTIHATRVAFKKFRYMLESLQPVLPLATDRRLETMQRYQSSMGDIQDSEVLLAGVKGFVQKRHPEKSLKRLQAALVRRRILLIRRYLRSADELFSFWPLTGESKNANATKPEL